VTVIPLHRGPVGLVLLVATSCSTEPSTDKAVADTSESTTSVSTNETGAEDTDDSSPPDPGADTATETGTPVIDEDSDGFPVEEDCDDNDPDRYPGAPEDCSDGVVNDCDGDVWSARNECGSLLSHTDALSTWSLSTSQLDAFRVRGIGDLDGDGYDDIAIGEPLYSRTELSVGSIRVFHGPHSGVNALGDEDALIAGEQREDAIGWDIAPMGDLDGDGYDDFAVGGSDPHLGSSASGTPSVYVVHGPGVLSSIREALLLVDSPSSIECLGSVLEPIPDADGDGVADILVGGRCDNVVRLFSANTPAQVPGTDDITTFTGPEGEGRFGHAFATGDLDGDGLVDVAIGDPDYHGDTNGSVTIFSSPPSGSVHYEDAAASILAEDEDSSNGHLLLGSGVAIGDLNGDGHDDLAAGAPLWSEDSREIGGILLVYFGPLTGTYAVGDASFRMKGDEDHQTLGGEVRSGIDLNGDNADDLLFGNGYSEINGTAASGYTWGTTAYVLTSPLTAGTWAAMDADYLLADSGAPTTDLFGQHLTLAGDSNGDGIAEVLVGNWFGTVHLFDIPPE